MGFISCLLFTTDSVRTLVTSIRGGDPYALPRDHIALQQSAEDEAILKSVPSDMHWACRFLGTCETLKGPFSRMRIIPPGQFKHMFTKPLVTRVYQAAPWFIALGHSYRTDPYKEHGSPWEPRGGGVTPTPSSGVTPTPSSSDLFLGAKSGNVPDVYITACQGLHRNAPAHFNTSEYWAGRYWSTNSSTPLADQKEVLATFRFLPAAVTHIANLTGHVWYTTLFAWPTGAQFPHTRGILWDYMFNDTHSHPLGMAPDTPYFITETVIRANLSERRVPVLSVREFTHGGVGDEANNNIPPSGRPQSVHPANTLYENFLTYPGNTIVVKNEPGRHVPAYGYYGPMPAGMCTMRTVYWQPKGEDLAKNFAEESAPEVTPKKDAPEVTPRATAKADL